MSFGPLTHRFVIINITAYEKIANSSHFLGDYIVWLLDSNSAFVSGVFLK